MSPRFVSAAVMLAMSMLLVTAGYAEEPGAVVDRPMDNSDTRPVITDDPTRISVPAGTQIKVRIMENLNSQYTKDDERILFEVVEDVILNDRVVIRRGDKAFGFVKDARSAKGWGKKGKVDFIIDSVQGADGYPIKVDFDAGQVAGNSTGEVAAVIYFAPIFGGGVKGKKARITKGTEYVITSAEGVMMHVSNLEQMEYRTPDVRITGSSEVDPRELQAEEHLIPAGTPITLVSMETINSNATSDGEYLFFEVAKNVVIDGVTVIKAGDSALGLVGDSRAAKGWGQKGKVEMEILSVKAVDGTILRLRSAQVGDTGESKTGETVLGVYALGLAFGGAMKGGKVNILKGTEFTVYLDESHTYELNSDPIPYSVWRGEPAPIRAVVASEMED